MASRMFSKLESVTPERAQELLAKNVANNRAIVASRVEMYAEMMRDGTFLPTPEGIMVDVEGRLIDGQHRLSAVILSGRTVKMHVWRNVPTTYMRAINTGAPRTLADVLTVTNELGVRGAPKIAVTRATAINLLFKPTQGTRKLTFDQYEDVRKVFSSSLEWSLVNYPNSGGTNAAGLSKRVRSSMVMGACIIAHRKFPNEVADFMRKATTGLELTETDPAYALRRFLEQANLRGVSAERIVVGYATLRCLHAFIKKEKISVVRPSHLTPESPEFNKILRFFDMVEE